MPEGTIDIPDSPPVKPVVEPKGPDANKPPAGETPPEPVKKFAGKYETQEAFAAGINEARKKLGLDEAEVFGDKGLYASPESAERGYRELTTLMRKVAPSKEPAEEMKLGEEPKPDEGAKTPEQIVEKAGLKWDEVQERFLKDGTLDDAEYKAIQKIRPGLSRELIDAMAQGMVAKAQVVNQARSQMRGEAATIVGGDDNLAALLAAAPSFVPADEKDAFNARLADPKHYKGALRDLMHMHAEAVGAGKAKPLASGTASAGPSVAKDASEWGRLLRAAANGDEDARRKIHNTPIATIEKWNRAVTG